MEADNDCGYTDINIKLQNKPANINSNEKFGRISGKYESNFTLRFRQVVAATGPFFSTLSAGMTSGFSAVLLPQLMKDDSSISITDVQASWIASIAVLPMAVGCIISGISMEKIGRRLTQRIANVLFIIGWILLSLSNDFKMLLFGRLMTGLCVGLFSPLCLVYVAETSDPLIRGTMLAFLPLGISSGILISHLLGTLLHWKIAASLCGLFPLTASIVLLFAPESPSWLILKGFTKEGERAFRQLRGYSTESSSELKSMLQKKNSMTDDILKSNKHILKQALSPKFLKPLFTMLTFFFIQQFSGINAVIFYSVNILSTISTSVNEYFATIIIDFVRVIMSAITCVLLKKFKRRTLAIFSSIATGIALLGFAISYKLLSKEYSWASLPFIIAYICFVNIGIVPLPWILTGEVFPRNLREVGSGCCTCFGFLMFFTVVKMSPFLFATFGPGNIFLMFALIALMGSIFIYCFLPETKNMTLENIENELTNKEFSLERSNMNL